MAPEVIYRLEDNSKDAVSASLDNITNMAASCACYQLKEKVISYLYCVKVGVTIVFANASVKEEILDPVFPRVLFHIYDIFTVLRCSFCWESSRRPGRVEESLVFGVNDGPQAPNEVANSNR